LFLVVVAMGRIGARNNPTPYCTALIAAVMFSPQNQPLWVAEQDECRHSSSQKKEPKCLIS
jgi:hypothetical protein